MTLICKTLCVVLCAAAAPASATADATADPVAPRRTPHQVGAQSDGGVARHTEFYPEHTEGGVRGNLPFNNQIRKLSDPLNANGAGR
jgi:hypothetical protein